MAGYSGTPLVKKLGIKEGFRIYAKNQPANYLDLIAPLPPGVKILKRISNELDMIHLFTRRQAELRDSIQSYAERIKPNPQPARRTFFYTLGDKAIGDLWEPGPGSKSPAGMNLRVYRPETQDWILAWSTPTLRQINVFTATQQGGGSLETIFNLAPQTHRKHTCVGTFVFVSCFRYVCI